MAINKPDVPAMDLALKALTRWKVFANHLRCITTYEIDTIDQDEPQSVEKKKMALFKKWLEVCPDASWSDVVTTLIKARENKLAQEIKSTKYTADTGISSMTVSTPADFGDYPYRTPVPATTFERSQLESGQQDTQNENSTEMNSKIHSHMSLEEQLKIEREHHTQTNEHKQRLLKEREELTIQLERSNTVAQSREQCHKLDIEEQKQNYQQGLEKANKLLKDVQQIHQQEMDTLATQQKITIQNISTENNHLAESLITELDNVKTELDTVKTELDNVKTELDTVKTELDNVETELDTVKTELDKANSDACELKRTKDREINKFTAKIKILSKRKREHQSESKKNKVAISIIIFIITILVIDALYTSYCSMTTL